METKKDEKTAPFNSMLRSVNPQDAELIVKTGFGHGCDITGEIGSNNCLAAILDYDLLKQSGYISVRRNFTTALTAARPLPPEHL